MATLTRVFEFDAAHRVMNERIKCFNLHGHRFKVELTFEYSTTGSLGYAIDFKEIKRVAGTFLDKYFDHTSVLNPRDTELISMCKKYGWRLWIMGLGNNDDINPSAENMANEILFVIGYMFSKANFGVKLKSIKFFETPNCWVEMDTVAYVPTKEYMMYLDELFADIEPMEYDIRNCKD